MIWAGRPRATSCGVAMRGLLHHYCGLELPEAAVFGLGSGAARVYLSGPGLDPSALVFGRTMNMEQDLATNLEIDYRDASTTVSPNCISS